MEQDNGTLYRLVEKSSLASRIPTVQEIDNDLCGSSCQQQISEICYVNPSNGMNVLMYLIKNENDPREKIYHLIDNYLVDCQAEDRNVIIGTRVRNINNNILQGVMRRHTNPVAFKLIRKLLIFMSPSPNVVECILQENFDGESALYIAIETDNAKVLRLLCRHLPNVHPSYSDINIEATNCEGPRDEANVIKQLTPFIVFNAMHCNARNVFAYVSKMHLKAVKLYILTLPAVWLKSHITDDFLAFALICELGHILTFERMQDILIHAIHNRKFSFVLQVLQNNQDDLSDRSLHFRRSLLEAVAGALLSHYDNRMCTNTDLIDSAMITFDMIIESCSDIHVDVAAHYLTSLVNDGNLCVMNIVGLYQREHALNLALKHTRLSESEYHSHAFLKYLVEEDQRKTLKMIMAATQDKHFFIWQLKEVIPNILRQYFDEYRDITMTVAMLNFLSPMVTSQYLVPFTSLESDKCIRSGIVYYDSDFQAAAEDMQNALQLICGASPGVSMEGLSCDGKKKYVSAKFRQNFGEFLADRVHRSSLLIISIISHGKAGNIYLNYDKDDSSENVSFKIKTILEMIRDHKIRSRDEQRLPTVIIISACQDLEGITEHDWDELIQEGSIQLMLNDTEVLFASKPGLPTWTGGYIQTLTKELTSIDGTNSKSIKKLHEQAVEQLIKNPDYWKLHIKDRQIPLLMSTAIKSIILTRTDTSGPNSNNGAVTTNYENDDYEAYYAEYEHEYDYDHGGYGPNDIND